MAISRALQDPQSRDISLVVPLIWIVNLYSGLLSSYSAVPRNIHLYMVLAKALLPSQVALLKGPKTTLVLALSHMSSSFGMGKTHLPRKTLSVQKIPTQQWLPLLCHQRGYLDRSRLNKNSGCQDLDEFPWLAVLHAYCHTLLLGEVSTLHTTVLGKDNWKICPWTLLDPALRTSFPWLIFISILLL